MAEKEIIAVAMSGGVDSSTVAALLQAEGHSIVGLTMQLWNQRRLASCDMDQPVAGRCCSIDDVRDARAVAASLGAPYYVVNEQERFERDVVQPFVDEYLAGRTPIPCAHCNTELKFDELLRTARQIGAEKIATGHYARNLFDEKRGRWILMRALDAAKDQTYFLFGLTQEQLARTLFPLGSMSKPAVREQAREHGLALADKPDSQEICFIPDGDYKRFLAAYLAEQGRALPDSSGAMITSDGRELARHGGVQNFTIGQRKGLGVATGSPIYVTEIRPATREVVVGPENELLRRRMRVAKMNWIAIEKLDGPLRVTAKIRHRHTPAPALIEPDGAGVRVLFDDAQRAITPGQAAVFYAGDEVIGGGWIESSSPEL